MRGVSPKDSNLDPACETCRVRWTARRMGAGWSTAQASSAAPSTPANPPSIRDKIDASKRKGMWMGGFVPLGYEPRDRWLMVNETEAETVRTLFALYLKLGNVRRVKEEADRLKLRSKRHGNGDGGSYGGVSFSRGAIYKILSNPIYIGQIVHQGERHAGSHKAIIEPDIWEA